MSNPWRESFDDLRYENGNTYDYFENISEATPYAVDFRKVREAVYQIKQKAKRDNIRLPVAMNQYFSTANLGPAERAAIRAKIMGMREDFELDEEQMTSSDKAKEKRLKSKYDKSGMKQSMIDQYGEKKGKQVYFAKIRKMAMEGLDSFDDETVLEDVYNEGKVPWHDPSRPLESGWTPAEKNAAKRKRTGVEDLSKQPSERDLERYGKMKSASDNEEMKDRVKRERQNKRKGVLSLFNKREKESAEEKPHEFKKVTIPDYLGGGTTTKGSQRREKGTKEGDKSGYVSKTWNKGTGKAQSPIDPEDRRTRGRGSGPNPKTRKESFSLESFVEEKYGEKYEKKYKKTGKKSKDYDGDGTIEDEADEYAGVKDRAIKKAMRKEASDWRADLGFFTEKRYLESPRVETMPPEKESDSEQGSKERAANKRLKPKSAEVKEDFEQLAEALGGQLVEFVQTKNLAQTAKNVITPFTRKSVQQLTAPVVKTATEKALQKAGTEVAEKGAEVATKRIASKLASRVVPGVGAGLAAIEAGQRFAKGDVLGGTLSAASGVPGPIGWGALGLDVLRTALTPAEVEKVKPTKTPGVKPTVSPPSTKPSTKPETQAMPDVSKTAPVGTKVKLPQPGTSAKSQTQTKPEKVDSKPPTKVSTDIITPTKDKEKKDWELPKLKLPSPTYGQGRTWVARSL